MRCSIDDDTDYHPYLGGDDQNLAQDDDDINPYDSHDIYRINSVIPLAKRQAKPITTCKLLYIAAEKCSSYFPLHILLIRISVVIQVIRDDYLVNVSVVFRGSFEQPVSLKIVQEKLPKERDLKEASEKPGEI